MINLVKTELGWSSNIGYFWIGGSETKPVLMSIWTASANIYPGAVKV